MIINHNLMANNAIRNMNINSSNAGKSMQKLSSGLRINSAADDAAGLAISEKMRGQIRGLDQAAANAQDGISMVQTAEGGLNETHSILQRMRELATQSANDTNVSVDRDSIQQEMNQLTSEINRIANTTEFNTKTLLNGQYNVTGAVTANVKGTSVGNTINIVNAATNGLVTGNTSISASGITEFHDGHNARATASTNVKTYDVSTGLTTAAGYNVVVGQNELTLSLNGVSKTITLATHNYVGGAAADSMKAMLDDIQAQLNTAFGASKMTVGIDTTAGPTLGKLYLEGGNANDVITVTGGGFVGAFSTAASNAIDDIKSEVAVARNDSFNLVVDGNEKTVTLTSVLKGNGATQLAGYYDFANDADRDAFLGRLNSDLVSAFGSGVVTASYGTGADNHKLIFTSAKTGSASSVAFGTGAGNALSKMGVATSTVTAGLDKNDTYSVTIDGETITGTLAVGNYNSSNFVNTLQAAINAATNTAADVKVTNDNGTLTITSGKTGAAGSVVINNTTKDNAAFAKAAGWSTGSISTAGKDAVNNDMQLQIGANQGQFMSVSINDMRAAALKITSATVSGDASTATGVTDAYYTTSKTVTDGTNNVGQEYSLDVSTSKRASAAIKVLDNAIASVSTERSKLGAYQNRLEHTINNLGTSSENLTSAESRIRDVDMAKEMSTYSKNNILSQAAQAMLAQANQQPQQVLQLLR